MERLLSPEVDVSRAAYVHDSALLYGKVTFGEGSSIWPNAVARAEMFEIVVGDYSNIQDFVMIHVGYASPTIVGAYCSITHHVTLHGCTVGDNCLIGINATLMDGCIIGENSIVAGHSIVNEGTIVPPNSIVMGVPGKVVKSRNNALENRLNAWMYFRNAGAYAAGHHREWAEMLRTGEYERERERLRVEFEGLVR